MIYVAKLLITKVDRLSVQFSFIDSSYRLLRDQSRASAVDYPRPQKLLSNIDRCSLLDLEVR